MDHDPMHELVQRLLALPEEELAKASHVELYSARAHAPKEAQDKLAAAEHRAFTREVTAEDPLMALPLALATVAYQPYKMIKGDSRSNASLNQLMQGLTGVGEGLAQRITSTFKGI